MLNLHTFPLVPYPGRPPEQAVRAAGGGWDPYALAAPADRFLPFVLALPRLPTSAAWVNCAWVEHADNPAQRVATLLPTGPTATTAPPNSLVLRKYADPVRAVDYFVYAGAVVPGLALPCGVPLRLVLDNAWQSPRFLAVADLSGSLLAEWWHPGPLAGVPYGAGLRQRLYVAGAGLAYGATRQEKETSKDAGTGEERTDFLALWRTATFATEPLPDYLAEALDGAAAHRELRLDGEPWRLKEVKPRPVGEQGGRQSMALTVERQQVVIARALVEPVLVAAAFDAVLDAARAWRCGDTTDTAADFRFTSVACVLDAGGINTGQATRTETNANPYSAGFGTTRTITAADAVRCPVPPTYLCAAYAEAAARDNCPAGEAGSSVVFAATAGQFTSRVSQNAADALAVAYVQAGKQANANTLGTCAAAAPSYGPVYASNGCFACQMVNANDAADVRPATYAESQTYSREFATNGTDNCLSC